MNKPIVSVIMSVYNTDNYLVAAIESVLSQTLSNFEFIIIDDGSKDRSAQIIKRYARRDKRIRPIFHSKNKGLIASLNYGVKTASGEFIARQDPDDISKPTRLQKQVDFLIKNPGVYLVGANYEVIDNDGQVSNHTDVFTHPDDIRLAEMFTNQFGHGTIMARSSILKSNLFDPKFKNAEDYDLWSRLIRDSDFANLKETLYQWRLHQSSATVSKASEMDDRVKLIQQREHKSFLELQPRPSLYQFHPFSTLGGPLSYGSKKGRLFRNLALLYQNQGQHRQAFLLLSAALVCAPWSASKTLRCFFALTYRVRASEVIEFETV